LIDDRFQCAGGRAVKSVAPLRPVHGDDENVLVDDLGEDDVAVFGDTGRRIIG